MNHLDGLDLSQFEQSQTINQAAAAAELEMPGTSESPSSPINDALAAVAAQLETDPPMPGTSNSPNSPINDALAAATAAQDPPTPCTNQDVIAKKLKDFFARLFAELDKNKTHVKVEPKVESNVEPNFDPYEVIVISDDEENDSEFEPKVTSTRIKDEEDDKTH